MVLVYDRALGLASKDNMAMSIPTHNTVCLLPWLDLQRDLRIGRFRFLRWPHNRSFFPEHADSVDKIAAIYKTIYGKPRENPTVLVEDSPAAFPPLDAGTEQHSHAVILLTLAVLSTNEYCKQGVRPTNSTCFETHFQNFTPGSDDLALVARRRDGHQITGGPKYDEVSFTEPLQCCSIKGVNAADSFLEALSAVLDQARPLDRLILQASDLFAQANTDAPNVLQEVELVTLVNALDRLCESPGSAKGLAKAFGKHFSRWGSKHVKQSSRHKKRAVDFDAKGTDSADWYLHKRWMWELYQLRNDYTHGNDISKSKWAWDPDEHLLAASFIFPRIVKVRLAEEGAYELTEEEDTILAAFDQVLDAERWFERGQAHGRWYDELIDASTDIAIRRSLEAGYDEFIARQRPCTDASDDTPGPSQSNDATGSPPS